MLQKGREIDCGVFDSGILRRQQQRSQNRAVSCYELELFHTDTGVSHVDGEAFTVRRGMLLCAKPGQVRYSDFPVRCSFIRLSPDETHADIAAIVAALPTCTYIGDEDAVDALLALFSRLSAHCLSAATDALTTVQVNGLFLELLYHCMRLCGHTGAAAGAVPAGRAVQDACEYIGEHYRGADCTLDKIAAALNLSPNHLHAMFKKATGKTPFAYMTALRIEHAKRLILVGEKSMLEIALETGFCSQSHFNRTFKAEVGETPAAYRRKMLERY